MNRIMIVLSGILVVAMSGSFGAFSWAKTTFDYSTEHVVNHSGETDRNGCHEDGSGGYHCH